MRLQQLVRCAGLTDQHDLIYNKYPLRLEILNINR